jgi:TetR/AcrR family transcriptional regulator
VPHLVAPATRRERRKDARPAELLGAALGLFVEKGFAATRAEEVARRAGVSKGTLFLYFPSKEELFKAVVRQNISGNFAHWREALADFKGSVAACLHLSAQGWWVHVGATQATGIMKLMLAEGTKFPDLANFYRDEVIEPGNAMLLDLLHKGVQCGEFRSDLNLHHVIHSFVAALLYLASWKHAPRAPDTAGLPLRPQAFLLNHVDLILRGICTRSADVPLAAQQAQAYIDTYHPTDCPHCPPESLNP